MSNIHLRNITNSYHNVRLASLASWKQASEIVPRDRGGPYVVTQEGFDPQDPNFKADEFILGRSGKWLSLSYFFRMPVPERRAEYVFGTAAEVMQLMSSLPSQVSILRPDDKTPLDEPVSPEADEMAAAFHASKEKPSGTGGQPT